jgi:type I restriction enzyme M protein
MDPLPLPGSRQAVTYDVPVPPTSPLAPQTVANWLTTLGFLAAPGSAEWTKSYPQHNYTIRVDTTGNGKIAYGTSVTVERQSTTNLLDQENLVVLECVDLLLTVGYTPSSLTLEKTFRLGHQNSGYLDILVRRNDTSYLMIECKTAGAEYNTALTKLKTSSGSQLMSYIQQDRDAEQAVLYSSKLRSVAGGSFSVERTYAGFTTALLTGSNVRQLFASWNKQTYTNGLETSTPYSLTEQSLTVGDLTDMTQEDGARLFNSFKEILRRHAVSDKPNAFNKIFNLFICKIQDEDKRVSTQKLDFQWHGSDTSVAALDRLSTLYAKGMKHYLELDLDDRTSAELTTALGGVDPQVADRIHELFTQARQFKNTDFAFIDVFDQASFEQNANIVRDIVRLLQRHRLRYSEKHGFMGLFFEKLLNTSMKQESGQFFTPPPVAQFINEALPIETMVKNKVDAGDASFLPYAIDYAAGSGHFLTEYMDRTNKVLLAYDDADFTSQTQAQNAQAWKHALTWAGEFVYGIELDYRLAKAAKVSTFLNGDGTAHVIRGNGLGHFHFDSNYQKVGGKLWRSTAPTASDRDLQNFDVVVANPPYSVSEFISSVDHAAESFELAAHVNAASDKIEALFVERTKQLLKDGGVAGIILPTSILSNPGVELAARRMLIRYFDIVAIVSLGGHVFIATGTPTSIVFLRRRGNSTLTSMQSAIDAFIRTGADSTIMGIANAVGTYAQDLYGATLQDYANALKAPLSSGLQFVADYEWEMTSNGRGGKVVARITNPANGQEEAAPALIKRILEQETARMEAYFLTRGKKTLHVFSPTTTRDEKRFLGYKFSDRKQHEGISLLSGTDTIDTPLYDPSDSNNPDKVSTLIKTRFDDPAAPIPGALAAYAEDVSMADLVGLTDPVFAWSLSGRPSTFRQFNHPVARLGHVADLAIGGTPNTSKPQYYTGTNPWVTVAELKGEVINDTSAHITDAAIQESNVKLVPAGTLLMSFKLTIGKTAITGRDMYTNEAIAAITPRAAPAQDALWVDTDYLHALLTLLPDDVVNHRSQGKKKIGQSLNLAFLRRVQIPLMSATDRQAVVDAAWNSSRTLAQRRQDVSAMLWP